MLLIFSFCANSESYSMINNNKVLAITLARGGSKSVPRKNIMSINGKPLIAYTITEVIKSQFIDNYLVSTDDQEIADVAKQWGAEVPFLRPAEFARDTSTSADALINATLEYEKHVGQTFDYIIEIMCTNPLKTVEDIDACIEKLEQTGADSVVSVVQLFNHHPARIKKIQDDKIQDFGMPEIEESRRQDLKPNAYVRNGSIYALKRETILDLHSRRGKVSRPHIMPQNRTVNIDEYADVFYAEYYLKNLKA